MKIILRAIALLWAALITVVVGWLAMGRFQDALHADLIDGQPAIAVVDDATPPLDRVPGNVPSVGNATQSNVFGDEPQVDGHGTGGLWTGGYETDEPWADAGLAAPAPEITARTSAAEHAANRNVAFTWLLDAFSDWRPDQLSPEPWDWQQGNPDANPWHHAVTRADARHLAPGGESRTGDELLREFSDRATRLGYEPHLILGDATELDGAQAGSGLVRTAVCVRWTTADGSAPTLSPLAGEVAFTVAGTSLDTVQFHPFAEVAAC